MKTDRIRLVIENNDVKELDKILEQNVLNIDNEYTYKVAGYALEAGSREVLETIFIKHQVLLPEDFIYTISGFESDRKKIVLDWLIANANACRVAPLFDHMLAANGKYFEKSTNEDTFGLTPRQYFIMSGNYLDEHNITVKDLSEVISTGLLRGAPLGIFLARTREGAKVFKKILASDKNIYELEVYDTLLNAIFLDETNIEYGMSLSWGILRARDYEFFQSLAVKTNYKVNLNATPSHPNHPDRGITNASLMLDSENITITKTFEKILERTEFDIDLEACCKNEENKSFGKTVAWQLALKQGYDLLERILARQKYKLNLAAKLSDKSSALFNVSFGLELALLGKYRLLTKILENNGYIFDIQSGIRNPSNFQFVKPFPYILIKDDQSDLLELIIRANHATFNLFHANDIGQLCLNTLLAKNKIRIIEIVIENYNYNLLDITGSNDDNGKLLIAALIRIGHWDLLNKLIERNPDYIKKIMNSNFNTERKPLRLVDAIKLKLTRIKSSNDESAKALLAKLKEINLSEVKSKKEKKQDKTKPAVPAENSQFIPLPSLINEKPNEVDLKGQLTQLFSESNIHFEIETKKNGVAILFTSKNNNPEEIKQFIEIIRPYQKELKGIVFQERKNNVKVFEGKETALLGLFKNNKLIRDLKDKANSDKLALGAGSSMLLFAATKLTVMKLTNQDQISSWLTALPSVFSHAKEVNIQWNEAKNCFSINYLSNQWTIRAVKAGYNEFHIFAITSETKDKIQSRLSRFLSTHRLAIVKSDESDHLEIYPCVELAQPFTDLHAQVFEEISKNNPPILENSDSDNEKSEIPEDSISNQDKKEVTELIITTDTKIKKLIYDVCGREFNLIVTNHKKNIWRVDYNYTNAPRMGGDTNVDAKDVIESTCKAINTYCPDLLKLVFNNGTYSIIVYWDRYQPFDLDKSQNTYLALMELAAKEDEASSNLKSIQLHSVKLAPNDPLPKKSKTECDGKEVITETQPSEAEEIFQVLTKALRNVNSIERKNNLNYHLNELCQIPVPDKTATNDDPNYYVYLCHATRVMLILCKSFDENNDNNNNNNEFQKCFYDFRTILGHADDQLDWKTFYHETQPFMEMIRQANVPGLIFKSLPTAAINNFNNIIEKFKETIAAKQLGKNKQPTKDYYETLQMILLSDLQPEWKRDAYIEICSLMDDEVKSNQHNSFWRNVTKIRHAGIDEDYQEFANRLFNVHSNQLVLRSNVATQGNSNS